jgi:hypothetical protein
MELPKQIREQLGGGDPSRDTIVVKLTGFHITRMELVAAKDQARFLFNIIDREHEKFAKLLYEAQNYFLNHPNHEAVEFPLYDKSDGITSEFHKERITRSEVEGMGVRGQLVMNWKIYKGKQKDFISRMDNYITTTSDTSTTNYGNFAMGHVNLLSYAHNETAVEKLGRLVETICCEGREL